MWFGVIMQIQTSWKQRFSTQQPLTSVITYGFTSGHFISEMISNKYRLTVLLISLIKKVKKIITTLTPHV